MVSSYTANGRITKQGTNDNPNTWGTVLNNQVIELFEEAIFGVVDIDVTGTSDVTLSTANGASDEARHAVIELTGLLGSDITLFVPATEKIYAIRGAWSGDYEVTVQISGSSTSVVIQKDQAKIVYLNGTDIYDLVDIDPTQFLNTANNLADLPDPAVARANLELGDFALKTIGTGFTESPSGTINVTEVPPDYIIGEVKPYLGGTAPSGFLLCQGQAVSRTTYSDLYSLIGDTYGNGDGSTTFNLPDYRGEFLRGFDAGKGRDPGRTLGSTQEDAFQYFTGFFGAAASIDNQLFVSGGNNVGAQQGDFTSGQQRVTFRPDRVARTADETRPKNVSINYIVYTGV